MTSPEEAIYIAGNFNDWQSGDENFRLQIDPAKGIAFIRIPRTLDTLQYQFNRGTLFSVESDQFGSPVKHLAAWNGSSAITTVDAKVSTWADAASFGNRIQIMVILFTAGLVVVLMIGVSPFRYNSERRREQGRVSGEKPKVQAREDEQALKLALSEAMNGRKLFLNPKLTLQELAVDTSVGVHTLSGLLNEGYGKNFFDFVNEHRIEEFKRVMNENQFPDYSFADVAMECGFSSKTTFNRAFKKHTGKTPREYFNGTRESDVINSESQVTLLKKRGQMF
jgi:AraC-like DNA-binding protein